MHLKELERQHGHRVNQYVSTCHKCRTAQGKNKNDQTEMGCDNPLHPHGGCKDGEDRRRNLRELDRYTKAMYHVLAVYDLTFCRGMDAAKFTARHKKI